MLTDGNHTALRQWSFPTCTDSRQQDFQNSFYFFIHKKSDICTEFTYSYLIVNIRNLCSYVLKSEGCKWISVTMEKVFFWCENYKSLISTYMHHRSTSTLFPALHSSVLAFLYRLNFCQISNMFCAFNHVEVECIFTLYHLFSSHPEVYSKYSSVLRNTFPMESESLD